MQTYWGSGDVAPHTFLTSVLSEMSGQLHIPAAGKNPKFSLDRGLCGPQGRSEVVAMRRTPITTPAEN